MKVQFLALIRKLEARLDDSGDKVGYLTVGFRDEKGRLGKLDKLFKPDHEINIVISDEKIIGKSR